MELVGAIKHPGASLETAVDEWIELFYKNVEKAIVTLINLFVQVTKKKRERVFTIS
jgi:hypothetical protein